MHLPLIHCLAYSWTGWPKSGNFPDLLQDQIPQITLDQLRGDGLCCLSHRWSPDQIQITARAEPQLSPARVAALFKGRLDHALRQSGWRNGFHRRVGLRSLGENTTETVLAYVARQLERADLADPRYVSELQTVTFENASLDLSLPTATLYGRYWHDLHIVAVTSGRLRVHDAWIARIRQGVFSWAEGFSGTGQNRRDVVSAGLRSFSLMPDHLHIAARGPVEKSPAELTEDLYRELNTAAGCVLFSDRIYVGTFSVYPLGCILSKAS